MLQCHSAFPFTITLFCVMSTHDLKFAPRVGTGTGGCHSSLHAGPLGGVLGTGPTRNQRTTLEPAQNDPPTPLVTRVSKFIIKRYPCTTPGFFWQPGTPHSVGGDEVPWLNCQWQHGNLPPCRHWGVHDNGLWHQPLDAAPTLHATAALEPHIQEISYLDMPSD